MSEYERKPTNMPPPAQKPIGTPMTPGEVAEHHRRESDQPPIQGPK